jgi:hypothetical protein
MIKNLSPLMNEIDVLSDYDKALLVDIILKKIFTLDPEIDKVWAHEAKKRWNAYKKGELDYVSYEEATAKYRAK